MARGRDVLSFPTAVQAEPAIRAGLRAASWPKAEWQQDEHDRGGGYGRKVGHWHLRTDIQGLFAITANAPYQDGRLRVGGEWHGVSTIDEAITLATNGWLEALPIITEQMERMEARKTRSLIPTVTWADEPGEPDVPTYLEGETDCYLTPTDSTLDTPAVGRSVRFVIEPCVSAGFGAMELLRRGAAIAAVIHTLETAGVSTAIEWRSLTTSGQDDCQIEVILKQFGEPFDIRSLAFWLAHPAASRVFAFSAIHSGKDIGYDGGIGWARRNPPVEDDVALVPRFTTFEQGGDLSRWIDTMLEKTGIKLNDEEGN